MILLRKTAVAALCGWNLIIQSIVKMMFLYMKSGSG